MPVEESAENPLSKDLKLAQFAECIDIIDNFEFELQAEAPEGAQDAGDGSNIVILAILNFLNIYASLLVFLIFLNSIKKL